MQNRLRYHANVNEPLIWLDIGQYYMALLNILYNVFQYGSTSFDIVQYHSVISNGILRSFDIALYCPFYHLIPSKLFWVCSTTFIFPSINWTNAVSRVFTQYNLLLLNTVWHCYYFDLVNLPKFPYFSAIWCG
jgi:hypothetical protein